MAERSASVASDADRRAILAVAETLAVRAGAILLDHLGRLDPAAIRTKSTARDLVTEADVASERSIVSGLRASFPAHAIEAEEEVHDAPDARLPRWFLDPLDGTVNFVHQIPAFAVSLALYIGLDPEVAVVHAPRLSETFTAVRGGGARLNGAPIRVSRTAHLGDAILATGFPYRRGELANDNLDNFARFYRDVRDLRRMGSAAMDLAYVAAGRIDGFWELHLSPHDVAAGALLVREAGGVVTDAGGGEEWLRGGSIVASGAELAGAIRARVRR
jgi:myo-inositol-1(or 4)-monophosphatase